VDHPGARRCMAVNPDTRDLPHPRTGTPTARHLGFRIPNEGSFWAVERYPSGRRILFGERQSVTTDKTGRPRNRPILTANSARVSQITAFSYERHARAVRDVIAPFRVRMGRLQSVPPGHPELPVALAVVSDTLAAVLRGEPNFTTLPAGTPPMIRRLLRRCAKLDYRPTPKQRRVIELLRYLSMMGHARAVRHG
jgi:hypothetical protein